MEMIAKQKFILPERVQKFKNTGKKKEKIQNLVLVLAGLFIGFVNGLFGAGGGMLAVPLLTLVAGLNMKHAHATAILVILPLCAVSSVVYLAGGIGDKDVFLPTILGVVIGGVIGAFALKKCSNIFLQIVFYGVMLLAGLKMIF